MRVRLSAVGRFEDILVFDPEPRKERFGERIVGKAVARAFLQSVIRSAHPIALIGSTVIADMVAVMDVLPDALHLIDLGKPLQVLFFDNRVKLFPEHFLADLIVVDIDLGFHGGLFPRAVGCGVGDEILPHRFKVDLRIVHRQLDCAVAIVRHGHAVAVRHGFAHGDRDHPHARDHGRLLVHGHVHRCGLFCTSPARRAVNKCGFVGLGHHGFFVVRERFVGCKGDGRALGKVGVKVLRLRPCCSERPFEHLRLGNRFPPACGQQQKPCADKSQQQR